MSDGIANQIERIAESLNSHEWRIRRDILNALIDEATPHIKAVSAGGSGNDDAIKTTLRIYFAESPAVRLLQSTISTNEQRQIFEGLAKMLNKMIRDRFAAAIQARSFGPNSDPEYLTQECMVEVIHRIPLYHYQSRFSTWAYAVALNHLRQEIRHTLADKRNPGLEPFSLNANVLDDSDAELGETIESPRTLIPGGSEHLDVLSRIEKLKAAIATVSDEQSSTRIKVLVMKVAGYPNVEISKILGIPQNTVSTTISRNQRTLEEIREGV